MTVEKELRILALEDAEDDAKLMERELRKSGLRFSVKRVTTREDFLREIGQFCPDLIIADYRLPSYDGLSALADLQERCPDVPFIFLSGTMGEEFAIETLKKGARDYVLKNRISRLVPAVVRVMQEDEERRARRAAEEALRESEERFRELAASAQDAIIMLDADGRVSYWNRSAERVFGWSSDEILGKELHLFVVPGEEIESYRKGFLHFRRTGEGPLVGKILELVARRKDGREIPVEFSVSALKVKGQWHAISILRDITERKQAEEALRRSEKRLSRAQKIGSIGNWHWDIPHDIFTWSAEVYRIFGLAPGEVVPSFEAFLHAVSPGEVDHVRGLIGGALRGETPYDFTHRIVLQDGSVKVLREQAEVTFDDAHRAVQVEGVIHDITEIKKTEDKLHRQVENVTALRDIGIAITSSLDLRVTLNILLEKLMTQLGVDAADVLLLDESSLYLNYAAGIGFRTSAIQNTHVRMGKGHAGSAAFERKTLIVSDMAETLTRSLKEESFKSYIAMPLLAQGRIKGVLEIFHRKALDTTPEWLNFLELLSGQAAIAIDHAALFESLQRTNVELTLSYDATLEGWGRALEFRDADTRGHTERVTEMTLRLARLIGMDKHELIHVRRGSLLHDIGKIHIPDSILLKSGKLTGEEMSVMQQHPVYAYELLSGIPFLRSAIEIPYYHHERWDGSGYPQGLKGKHIPFKARVFSVIDVADALISDRPYRQSWSVEKTYKHIESLRGIHFDPEVVTAFLDMKWE